MPKGKGGGAPRGNKNAAGAHVGHGRKLGIYDLKNKSEKAAFQQRFPGATNKFLKKFS